MIGQVSSHRDRGWQFFSPLNNKLLGMIPLILFVAGIEVVYVSSGFVGGTVVQAVVC